MRNALLAIAFVLSTAPAALADVWVKGHYDADGNWVPGYWRTEANGTTEDNYSSGAYNPYKPKPPKPPTPWRPYTEQGTPLYPPPGGERRDTNKIEIPRFNAPAPSLNPGPKPCERKNLYDPPCPV